MLALSRHQQLVVGLALATVMFVTRGQHFASVEYLPDASWAIFFLAGIYLRPVWAFPALLAQAGMLDFAAVTWGGVSNFCVSPAYGFLLPAYGALWLAGRWYAARYRFHWKTLMPLTGSLLGGAVVCELFSSGSFYFLSGRFADTNLAQFAERLAQYFPPMLEPLLFYVGLAVVMHVVVVLGRRSARKQESATG